MEKFLKIYRKVLIICLIVLFVVIFIATFSEESLVDTFGEEFGYVYSKIKVVIGIAFGSSLALLILPFIIKFIIIYVGDFIHGIPDFFKGLRDAFRETFAPNKCSNCKKKFSVDDVTVDVDGDWRFTFDLESEDYYVYVKYRVECPHCGYVRSGKKRIESAAPGGVSTISIDIARELKLWPSQIPYSNIHIQK